MIKSFRRTTDERLSFASIVPMSEAIEAFNLAKSNLGLIPSFSESLTGSYSLLTVFDQNQNTSRVFLFQPDKTLGTGAQGQIFLAQEVFGDKSSNMTKGKLVVIKKMHDQILFKNEKKILEHLGRHHGTYQNDNNMYLVSEYAPGKNLLDTLYKKENNTFFKINHDPIFIQKIMSACLKEMDWYHQEMGVLHRDIKPDNIIIIESRGSITARFIDLDSACLIQQSDRNFCGTHGYQPPEAYLPLKERPIYSLQSEYYSLGVVFCEMLTAQKIDGPCNYQEFISTKMQNWKEKDQLGYFNQGDLKLAFPEIFNPLKEYQNKHEENLYKTITKMTHENPNERPAWDEIPKVIRNLSRKNLDDYMRTNSLMFSSSSEATGSLSDRSEKLEKPGQEGQTLLLHQFNQLSLVGRDVKKEKDKNNHTLSKSAVPQLALDQLPTPILMQDDSNTPVHSPLSSARKISSGSSGSLPNSASRRSPSRSISIKGRAKSHSSATIEKKKSPRKF